MDRRLLFFPAAATVCWAQQANPAADEAKQALIGRVQTYYQLMMDKKYRQAESMVAEESKEDYYNGKKPDIRGFDLMNVVVGENQTTATVTIKAKVRLLMPGAGPQLFEMPSPTYWKLERGEWCWYVPEEVKHATPFGKFQNSEDRSEGQVLEGKGKAPQMGQLQNQVSVDKTSIELSVNSPDQDVVIQNGLPGPLTLRLDPHAENIRGLTVKVDKLKLESGEKAKVSIHWTGSGKISDTVEITAAPINRAFSITVKTN